MSSRRSVQDHGFGRTPGAGLLVHRPCRRRECASQSEPGVRRRSPVADPVQRCGGNGGQPDLSPLQRDFEVLGTSTSSQFSMINGRTSSLHRVAGAIVPRRSGDLTIPALQSGSERSQPLTLKVTDTPPPAAAGAARAAPVCRGERRPCGAVALCAAAADLHGAALSSIVHVRDGN